MSYSSPNQIPFYQHHVSSSESGWASSSEWSNSSSRGTSPVGSLHSPRSYDTNGRRGLQQPSQESASYFPPNFHQQGQYILPFPDAPISSGSPSLTLPTLLPSSVPTPTATTPGPPKIKRSPNAFLLFRSDFIKRGVIPSDVESRQQNLSRVCGEVWNLASPEVKAKWQAKAKAVLELHQKAHPTYKFSPAARGTARKARNKVRVEGGKDNDSHDHIRGLREKYVTSVSGPAVAPTRRRKAAVSGKASRSAGAPATIPLPLSLPSTPSMSPHSGLPHSDTFFPSPQFLHYPIPQYAPRRPSTSMGFRTFDDERHVGAREGMELYRPSSAMGDYQMRSPDTDSFSSSLRGLDLDRTPTTTHFQYLPMLTHEHDEDQSMSPGPEDPLRLRELRPPFEMSVEPTQASSSYRADESFPVNTYDATYGNSGGMFLEFSQAGFSKSTPQPHQWASYDPSTCC